jgi:hypothetical protein
MSVKSLSGDNASGYAFPCNLRSGGGFLSFYSPDQRLSRSRPCHQGKGSTRRGVGCVGSWWQMMSRGSAPHCSPCFLPSLTRHCFSAGFICMIGTPGLRIRNSIPWTQFYAQDVPLLMVALWFRDFHTLLRSVEIDIVLLYIQSNFYYPRCESTQRAVSSFGEKNLLNYKLLAFYI